MAKPFSAFTDNFFWDFKSMDNVNYNFEVLKNLYQAKKQLINGRLFNKPIVIQIVSIIECCLFDFLTRMKQRTIDPINVVEAVINYYKKAGTTDELNKILKQIESQNLLKVSIGDTLYEDLHFVRKARNRAHIQNRYRELDKDNSSFADERHIFTDSTVITAQTCLEKVIDFLCNKNPRFQNKPIPMTEFPRPWL